MQTKRYINRSAFVKLRLKRTVLMIWGTALTAFFGLATLVSLTNEELSKHLGTYVSCLAVSLVPLFFGIRSARLLAAVNRYNLIFEADRDGKVQLDELTRQTGLDSGRVLTRLEKLFRMGMFQNCSLERSGADPGVILNDAVVGERMLGYVNVKCASCGGTTRIRMGTVGVCEYCGSPIQSKIGAAPGI